MLPMTGPNSMGSDVVLDAVCAEINDAGGVDGKPVQLVYEDTAEADIAQLAKRLAEDESIAAVVGPQGSAECLKAVPHFIKNKKLIISPMATSVDLFKIFGKRRYFWRTCQGDMAQAKVIIDILKDRKVKRLALLCEKSGYGRSFLEWLPFYAIEAGLEVAYVGTYEAGDVSRLAALKDSLAANPECVVLAGFVEDVTWFKRQIDKRDPGLNIFLTDASQTDFLTNELGPAAEGLEGISPTSDPGKEFDALFQAYADERPNDYTAQTLDAFLLSVFAIARHDSTGGREDIAQSLRRVVDGTGKGRRWNRVDLVIDDLTKGKLPEVDGSSGSLEFDREFGVDPLSTWYSHWRVVSGDFETVEKIDPRKIIVGTVGDKDSLARTRGSRRLGQVTVAVSKPLPLPKRSGLKVVIAATSNGWENYRHQSDALNIYQLVRKNGVKDDDIVLFLADDVAGDKANDEPGVIRSSEGGPDLRAGCRVDYSSDAIDFPNLRSVLLGRKGSAAGPVLESDANTDILLYLVDHGNKGALPFLKGDEMSRLALKATLDEMRRVGRFRRMLVIVESCFSESLVSGIDTPGVVFMTSASRNEQSFGMNYKIATDTWLTDEFSWRWTDCFAGTRH